MTPNFSKGELSCRHCGMAKFAPGFIQALQGLRDAFNKPMVINSACRCKAHNGAIGGHPRSLHVGDDPYHNTGGCCAVDIGIPDTRPMDREILAILAYERGWSIGHHPQFLHLDLRTAYTDLPAAIFNY
jgi:hypothetical protein